MAHEVSKGNKIARHPELIDKSPPFGMADDEAPAWPKHSGCVPTGTRLVGDIAVHGVHENHVHAGWVEFEQGDVSSVADGCARAEESGQFQSPTWEIVMAGMQWTT